ncbi:hypothetical protein [Sinomicrobium sp.]
MKSKLLLIPFLLLFIFAHAQKELDSITYEQTQDINFFSTVKNNTQVYKYTTINGNQIKIGDTVVLGMPTSGEVLTRTYGGSYGSGFRGGVADSRGVSKKTYEFVKLGRPAGFGSVMNAMAGEASDMASLSLKNTKAIVREMKAYHQGSKKKPLYLVIVLGEINDRAFGINKYLSVMNTELAIESGEILLSNRKMTRDEAIAKLKEAKELLDLDMITKEDFEKLKEEVGPIIKAETDFN